MTDTAGLKPDVRAALWMGLSVFLLSWEPLAAALVGDTVGPFVFQFWNLLTAALVWFAYLVWAHPGLAGRSDVWVWILRRCRSRDGLAAILPGFYVAFFVWATLFLDTALVAVITGGWLILFVVYQKRHDDKDDSGRYLRLTVQDWLLMAVAMLGVALLILSQSGGVATEGGWRLLAGVLLATASAGCGSWISFRFKLGTELYRCRYKATTDTPDDRGDELACVIAVSIVTSLPAMAGGLLIGLTFFPAQGGFVSAPVVWVLAVGIVGALGNIAFRYANLLTSNLAVNAMQYLEPVLSLVWLAAFATVTVVRTGFLWVGAAAVISMNALINFRAGNRSVFK